MIDAMDPKKDPDRRCLKPEQWPEADRLAWASVVTPDNVLEPGGLGANWAPLTRRTIAQCYGGWLNWLARTGLFDALADPAVRVTPERIVRYVRDLQQRNSAYTVLSRVRHLCDAIQAMAPDGDWRWLRKIARRLRRSVKPKRKKETLILPANQLWDYGLELMQAADADPHGSALARAAQFRDGLLIATLAARPIRRRNLTSLEIGRHLVRQGDGYWICLPAAETKTRVGYEAPLPLALVPYLDRYLAQHRPTLLQYTRNGKRRLVHPPGDRLWITNFGSAMSEGSLYARITKLTAIRFGHALSPHLFRDIAATSIAVENSAHVQITMPVLGHTSLATSEKHYNHARSLEATRRYQKHVLALRRQGRDGGERAGAK